MSESIDAVGNVKGVQAIQQLMQSVMEVMLAAMQLQQAASQAGGLQGLKDAIGGNLQNGADQVGGGSGPGGVQGPSGADPLGQGGGGIMQMLQQLLQLLMQLMQQMAHGGMNPNDDAKGPGDEMDGPSGGPTNPGPGGPGGPSPYQPPPAPKAPPSGGGPSGPGSPKAPGTPGTGGPDKPEGPSGPDKPNSPTGNSTNPFSKEPQNGPLSEAEGKEMAKNVAEQLQKDFGFTPEQAAGIAGNLWHESAGMNANVNEFGSDPNSPTYGAPNGTQFGYGWAQWTGERKTAFLDFCEQNGLDPASPYANYEMLKHELKTSEAATIDAVKATDSPEDAAVAFRKVFERAAMPLDEKRTSAARILFAFMNGGGDDDKVYDATDV